MTVEFWELHGWSVYATHHRFSYYLWLPLWMLILNLWIWIFAGASWVSNYNFFVYIGVPLLSHLVRVDSKLRSGILRKLRRDIFDLNLYSFVSEVLNINSCSEKRFLSFCLWKESEWYYNNAAKIPRSLSFR